MPTRRWPWIVGGITAVLVVAIGIANDRPLRPASPGAFTVPTEQPAAAPTTPPVSPEEEEVFGPRLELGGGLVLKQLGKVTQWGGPQDADLSTWAARMVVDRIEVDPECDPYVDLPERGHRLVLSVRVETSERYRPGLDTVPQFYEWSTIGPDGVSEASHSSSHTCRSAVAFPHELRPSARYRGEVTVETANPAGQLVFDDFAVYSYPTPA